MGEIFNMVVYVNNNMYTYYTFYVNDRQEKLMEDYAPVFINVTFLWREECVRGGGLDEKCLRWNVKL